MSGSESPDSLEPECPEDLELPLPSGTAGRELLAQLARALGHPARLVIMEALLHKERCVAGELAEELPLANSTVSQHLKVLKEVGLIKGEVDGPRRCYCIDRSVLETFRRLAHRLCDLAPPDERAPPA